MLYVKIMSGEDLPDTDPYKHYSIIPIENNEVMEFGDNPEYLASQRCGSNLRSSSSDDPAPKFSRYVMLVNAPDGGSETHYLWGNAYVMSESGKTIASHGA